MPKKQPVVQTPVDLPFSSDAFREAWAEWCEWRKTEKKEPVGPIAAKRQLKLLAKYDEATAIAMIDRSINSNWTGLWPPKEIQAPTIKPRLII